jgi:signal transduction histidine kinase
MAVRAVGKGRRSWSDALLGRPWLLVAATALFIAVPVLVLGQASENDTRARLQAAQLDSAARLADAVNRSFDDRKTLILDTLVSVALKPRPDRSLMGAAVQSGDTAALQSIANTVQSIHARSLQHTYIAVRGQTDTINDAAIVAESPAGSNLIGQLLSGRTATPAGLNAMVTASLSEATVRGAVSAIYAGSAAAPSGVIVTATIPNLGSDLLRRGPQLATIVAEVDVAGTFAESATPFLGPGDDAYLLDGKRLLAARAQRTTPFPLRDLSNDPFVQLIGQSRSLVRADVQDPLGAGPRVISSARPSSTDWVVLVVRDATAVNFEIDAILGQLAAARYVLVALLLVGALLLSQAASAQVRQRRALADANSRTEAASLHKSAFLANMSHELRTPLNSINGFSDVLLTGIGGPLTAKQQEYLADIRSSGEHLLALVNDVLDLSKVEAGKMDLQPTEFDLRETIDGVHRTIAPLAQQKGQRLELEVAGIGTVRADQARLRQVLLNVLSNAVKYTPQGGSIVTTAARRDGTVAIRVRDSGVGIAPQDQARVFEDFTRLDDRYAREQQGTGLGLSLARRLARLMGGDIVLESAPGQGSTFTITVPAA